MHCSMASFKANVVILGFRHHNNVRRRCMEMFYRPFFLAFLSSNIYIHTQHILVCISYIDYIMMKSDKYELKIFNWTLFLFWKKGFCYAKFLFTWFGSFSGWRKTNAWMSSKRWWAFVFYLLCCCVTNLMFILIHFWMIKRRMNGNLNLLKKPTKFNPQTPVGITFCG